MFLMHGIRAGLIACVDGEEKFIKMLTLYSNNIKDVVKLFNFIKLKVNYGKSNRAARIRLFLKISCNLTMIFFTMLIVLEVWLWINKNELYKRGKHIKPINNNRIKRPKS